MKRFFCVVFAVLLAAVCFAASAEEEQSPGMTCSVEDGRLVIRVPRKADDAGSWEADESEENDSVITLSSSDITDSLATFVYAPVKDGYEVIEVYHTVGPVCDEYYQFVVMVENGVIAGAEDGDHVISPEDALLDPFLIGEWLEVDTQFHTLTVTDNDTSGWDLTVVSPMTHGAYRFVGTVLFDCDDDVLVYTNGAVYNLPVTDGEDDAPETPAVKENLLGLMFLDVTDVEDGELVLIWQDPMTDEPVYFVRSDENAPDILAPEIVDMDTEDELLPDGVYWAGIHPDALSSGSLENTVFGVVDVYSGVDIGQIDPGEMLFREYRMYWIDSFTEDGIMQFTDASTGITGIVKFVSIPGSNDYVALDTESGFPLLTVPDIHEMPLDDAAKMTVITGESLEETAVDAAGMADMMDPEAGMTLVVVRDSRVQEIRYYQDVSVAGMMADVRSGGSEQ